MKILSELYSGKHPLTRNIGNENVLFYGLLLFFPFLYIISVITNSGLNFIVIPALLLFGIWCAFFLILRWKKVPVDFLLNIFFTLVIVLVYGEVYVRDVATIEVIFALTGVVLFMLMFQSLRPGMFNLNLLFILSILIHNLALIKTQMFGSVALQSNFILLTGYVFAIVNIFEKKRKQNKLVSLSKEQMLIQNDLKIAKAVQESLFPGKITFPGKIKYEIYRVAQNQIGGDFYDFIQLREGNLGIFFTDVAGHGISASMVAAILKVVVSTIPYNMKLDPVAILGKIDTVLLEEFNHYHASAVYMYLDFIEKKILLGNAGHPYVIHSRNYNAFDQIQTDGAIMGFGIKNPLVTVKEISMEAGDRFFIYSDGLVESLDPEGNALGEDRLVQMLDRHREERDLAVFKDKLLCEIEGFFRKKEFEDDVLFLLFEIV